MKAPRVHYHTDNDFFAGCEQMLVVLVGEAIRTGQIQPSLSYRASREYEAGLRERAPYPIEKFPLPLPDPNGLAKRTKARFPSRAAQPIRGLVHLFLAVLPVRQLVQVYDILVLRRLFSKLEPDIVHINNGGFPGAASCTAAAIAARLAGVRRVVYVVNSQAYGYTSVQRWYEYPLERAAVRCVTRFVTGSKVAAARLKVVLRLPPGKAVSIPNGIACREAEESPFQVRERLGVGHDEVLIVCVGALAAGKGHRYAVEAFSRLLSKDPTTRARLIIVGVGPERKGLEHQIEKTSHSGRIRIIPSEPNIWNLYKACDIVVFPSVAQEDFPNVVLEAMANAKPVIASAIAGVPEQVVDGETGLLVPPADPEALESAMRRLVGSEELRTRFGEAGRRRFEKEFTASKAARTYFDLYRQLLEDQQARR